MSYDEFEHYDLSEFTEEELVQFDIHATNKLLQKPDHGTEIPPTLQQDVRKTSPSGLGGGPVLDIAFESLTDAFLVEEIPKPAVLASTSPQFTSSHGGSPRHGKNPYEQFCSWKRGFSVTDLVSPIWCEVQFEYGLYGGRHKPLERRPSAFVSKHGKEINVQQKVAQQNDRTLKRGASIHKTLEREVRPETVPVRTTTYEERWALRFFNFTAGLDQLVHDGRTRELPVFGVTHGQVVFGIIDEVTRCVPSESHKHHNQIKRNAVSLGLSPVKKQRRSPSPSKTHIPIFHPEKSIPKEARIPEQLPPEEEVHDTCVIGHPSQKPIHLQSTFYDLTLIDYKTRRTPSLPPEEDTVSSQLQLMLYHRLLSGLLLPETFDFDALWAKQGINPHKAFSRSFLEDIGWPIDDEKDLPELHVDLCSMVAALVSVVHSARSCGDPLRGVGPELQIIYRKAGADKSSFYSRQMKPGFENKLPNNPPEALGLQEELDIARAIEESLRQFDQETRKATSEAVIDDMKNTHATQREELSRDEVVDPGSPSLDNLELDRAVQDSIPACSSNILDYKAQLIVTGDREGTLAADESANLEENETRILSKRNGETPDEGDTSGFSMILGTKKFLMDNDRLDTHLEDILQWWFGIRPPRGVELVQSSRCFTCEYRDDCEWREQKAHEVAVALGKRKIQL